MWFVIAYKLMVLTFSRGENYEITYRLIYIWMQKWHRLFCQWFMKQWVSTMTTILISLTILLEHRPKNTLSTKKASLQRIRLEFSDPNLFEYNSNSYIVYLSEGWLTWMLFMFVQGLLSGRSRVGRAGQDNRRPGHSARTDQCAPGQRHPTPPGRRCRGAESAAGGDYARN